MSEKILIRKSKTTDTRTCDWSKVSKEELLESSNQHIGDVQKGIHFLIKQLEKIADNHDRTKISYIDDFHRDFQTGFKNQEWWNRHKREERHHLKDPEFIKDNVDLLDILEMIIDGVMAGMSRSGEYRKEDIPDDLLRKAFDNTIVLLLNNVIVLETKNE